VRIGFLLLDVAAILALLTALGAQVRRLRRGAHPSNALLVPLVLLLWLALLALGPAIGYALRGTALAAAIGFGVDGVLQLIIGPLVRIWAAGRLAQRRAGGDAA
jgi:hypothetical protein